MSDADIVNELLESTRQCRALDRSALLIAAAQEIQGLRQDVAITKAAWSKEKVLNELIQKVEQWACERRIIPNSNPLSQLMKTVSELGELADATLKSEDAGVVDGIGDVLVTLIIYARLQGVGLEECLASAYDTIKDRKGTLTPEGVFVKDE